MRDGAHRGEHVARLLRVIRAGAARGYRESHLVKFDNECLTVDVQTENVTMWASVLE